MSSEASEQAKVGPTVLSGAAGVEEAPTDTDFPAKTANSVSERGTALADPLQLSTQLPQARLCSCEHYCW